jgi:DNA-binding transcriptional regulator YhcF (GntR family)
MEGNMIETGIQLDEKRPLYEKVAGKIIFLIEQGTLRPGEKVLLIRNLA